MIKLGATSKPTLKLSNEEATKLNSLFAQFNLLAAIKWLCVAIAGFFGLKATKK